MLRVMPSAAQAEMGEGDGVGRVDEDVEPERARVPG
jgi:hypothetical protein